MKKFNIFTACLLGLSLALTSCGDAADQVTDLIFGRNFSPTDLEANGIGEEKATLKWNASAGATSYLVEVFEDDSLTFEGTPIRSFVVTEPTASLTGLFYDTPYSARVQAITDDDESRTSNWSEVYFKTSAKQFLKNPKEEEIADRSVTLSWEVEEGFDVSTIVIGNITHQITDEEREAGQATIEGLTPETTYTVYLYYNGKQCGNRSFTTIMDLEGAILVHSDDNLKKLIEDEELEDGAVFALYGGTYELNVNDDGQTGAAKVNKTITIKGIFPTNRPVIKGRFEINEGAGLGLSQVVVDGTNNATSDQLFNYKTAGVDYGALDIQNCEITGLPTAKGILYLNVASTVESVTINNSIVHGIQCEGGDFIDSRTGYIASLTLSNSTFYDVAGNRDFIRMDDASGTFPGRTSNVTVDHCTLYNVGANSANYRLLYVRFVDNKITFTNNIVVGTNYKRGFTNQSKTDQEPTLTNNFYFNCQNLTAAGTGADATISWFDTDGTIGDPGFANAAKADFTLNADAAANRAEAGDPRWLNK